MEWMKESLLHIIALFISTNLTEVGQPLDNYLAACLKRMLCQLKNGKNIERVEESLGLLNGGSRGSDSGKVTIVSTFKPSFVLSELRELFY